MAKVVSVSEQMDIKNSISNVMEIIARARAKQAMNRTPYIKPEKQEKCSLCHDKEYIWNDDKQAMIPCKCHALRNMERRLSSAGISKTEYAAKSLDNFPTDREEAWRMKALAVRYINERKKGESIAYTGKPGTMKTTICTAICLELTTKYAENHKYFSYRDEIPLLKWQMFNKADEYQNTMKNLITCENLFIDDLFKTKTTNDNKPDVTATDLQIMFQLINGRYINKKSTLFSSEYSLMNMIAIDEAIGTRIFEMCGRFKMNCSDINRRLA